MRHVVVIGSGFGGSVAALRLAEKGYRVTVLEKGRRWRASDFPRSNWNVWKYLWAPRIFCHGIQQLTFFRSAFVLSGVGVGGGSLVYGNTHFEPHDSFFQHPAWSGFRDWKTELAPHYATARRMLGTTPVPRFHREDEILREVAREMGREATFRPTEVGVYFGKNEKTDPYFQGRGPVRTSCKECAGCMVGCRHGAKNSLDLNYLHLAEKLGAEIRARHTVTRITPAPVRNGMPKGDRTPEGGWIVEGSAPGGRFRLAADGVVLSAGVLGTMEILFRQKQGTMPGISPLLGEEVRTNSEMLCGTLCAEEKLNNGVAISSSFHPNDHTHVQICKYPNGSGLLTRLGWPAAPGGTSPLIRALSGLLAAIRKPGKFLRFLLGRGLAENTVFFLVMQSLDSSFRFEWNSLRKRLRLVHGKGARVPSWLPVGQTVMDLYTKKSGGLSLNSATEVFLETATTAHILGGCPIGATSSHGVVDDQFRLHGYRNFWVLDGSIVPGNLGVNPSLTITALAEWAMARVATSEVAPSEPPLCARD